MRKLRFFRFRKYTNLQLHLYLDPEPDLIFQTWKVIEFRSERLKLIWFECGAVTGIFLELFAAQKYCGNPAQDRIKNCQICNSMQVLIARCVMKLLCGRKIEVIKHLWRLYSCSPHIASQATCVVLLHLIIQRMRSEFSSAEEDQDIVFVQAKTVCLSNQFLNRNWNRAHSVPKSNTSGNFSASVTLIFFVRITNTYFVLSVGLCSAF
jgi:hypothetical protein